MTIKKGQCVNSYLPDKRSVFQDRFLKKTLPFLCTFGWDTKNGGLFETLDSYGKMGDENFRRVMLHGRQLFTFSKWGEETGDPNFIKMADNIFEYMKDSFWDGKYGGWHNSVWLDGSRRDSSKDLYSHAFVLFGLVNYLKCLKRPIAKYWIKETLLVLERKFSRPDNSYCERMTREFKDQSTNIRNQNAHMHLLEAALALCAYSSEKQHINMATRLVRLFESRFFDQDQFVIREYLDENFRPNEEVGYKVEPGHHYEWAWLLKWASAVLEENRHSALGKKILLKAITIGWDQEVGGVFDEMDCRDNSILLSSKRLWPLLELIKALSVFPIKNNTELQDAALGILLSKYLGVDGLWIERFSRDWEKIDGPMPVSSAYHLGMALITLENSFDS